MEIISGVERRRRWSKETKLKILAEADQPGVRIGDVARRHDIYPAQIRLWRKTLSHFEASTSFFPVQLVDDVSLGHQRPQTPAEGEPGTEDAEGGGTAAPARTRGSTASQRHPNGCPHEPLAGSQRPLGGALTEGLAFFQPATPEAWPPFKEPR